VDSIRASFVKELRRVRDKINGSPADDVCKPTLWYFDLLLYTAGQENPRKSKNNLDEEAEEAATCFDELILNMKCTSKWSPLIRVW
jgi:hypothetical protein